MFIPETSGHYRFYSESEDSTDVEATLFDIAHNEIGWDDESGGNAQFRLSKWLDGGETYYLRVYFYGDGDVTINIARSILTVEDPVPSSYNVVPGESVTLSVNAFSDEEISYQWTLNGEEVISTSETCTYYPEGFGEVVCEVSAGGEQEGEDQGTDKENEGLHLVQVRFRHGNQLRMLDGIGLVPDHAFSHGDRAAHRVKLSR